MRNTVRSTNIVALESSPESLKEQFNGDREKIQFLALLSPTGPYLVYAAQGIFIKRYAGQTFLFFACI
ncbi:MAG: hypothetical protein PVJ77_23770, partial [Desulfobacterales bacterium]